MSEELYNSSDYCSLAEQYEQARNEVEKLQKIILNLSEYHGSAEKTIEKLNSDVEKWRNTALQLSNNHGQVRNKVDQLEADYIISNRELLILQQRIAELEEERRWIPVSERLPELDQDVLAAVEGDIVTGHFYQQFDGEIYFDSEEDAMLIATHWMPLPKLPEADYGIR